MAYGEKDLALWEKWNRTKSPQDLEALLKELDPLISSEVNRKAGTLNRGTLNTQAKVLAVQAIKSYNPTYGTKLSTHVINQLQKLSRMNYANQNVFRVPERNLLQFQTFSVAKENLTDSLGREPTVEELSDDLGWSTKRVTQLRDCADGNELLESNDVPTQIFTSSTHDPRLGYAYHSLSPRQQEIFRRTTGYEGTKRQSGKQIMKSLNITQGQLSYEKTKIKKAMIDAYR